MGNANYHICQECTNEWSLGNRWFNIPLFLGGYFSKIKSFFPSFICFLLYVGGTCRMKLDWKFTWSTGQMTLSMKLNRANEIDQLNLRQNELFIKITGSHLMIRNCFPRPTILLRTQKRSTLLLHSQRGIQHIVFRDLPYSCVRKERFNILFFGTYPIVASTKRYSAYCFSGPTL